MEKLLSTNLNFGGKKDILEN